MATTRSKPKTVCEMGGLRLLHLLPEGAPLRQPGLAARGLAQHSRAAAADHHALRVAEDGGTARGGDKAAVSFGAAEESGRERRAVARRRGRVDREHADERERDERERPCRCHPGRTIRRCSSTAQQRALRRVAALSRSPLRLPPPTLPRRAARRAASLPLLSSAERSLCDSNSGAALPPLQSASSAFRREHARGRGARQRRRRTSQEDSGRTEQSRRQRTC